MALSLFLLIGAGLFARSLWNLRPLDAGINDENIVQFRLSTGEGYSREQITKLYKRLLARLAVAAIAGYLPARRAAAVDPIIALRSE